MTMPPLPSAGEISFKDLQARGWTRRMIREELSDHCRLVQSYDEETQMLYPAEVVERLEGLEENAKRIAAKLNSQAGEAAIRAPGEVAAIAASFGIEYPRLPGTGGISGVDLMERGWSRQMIVEQLADHCRSGESCEELTDQLYPVEVVRKLEKLTENADLMAQVRLSRFGAGSAGAQGMMASARRVREHDRLGDSHTRRTKAIERKIAVEQ